MNMFEIIKFVETQNALIKLSELVQSFFSYLESDENRKYNEYRVVKEINTQIINIFMTDLRPHYPNIGEVMHHFYYDICELDGMIHIYPSEGLIKAFSVLDIKHYSLILEKKV